MKKIIVFIFIIIITIMNGCGTKKEINESTKNDDKSILENKIEKNFFINNNNIEKLKTINEYFIDTTNTTINQMDVVKFGTYPQSDVNGKIYDEIEWIILDKDVKNRKAFLLSKYILDCKQFHHEQGRHTWEYCDLRSWLNNEFFNTAFTSEEKEIIITTNNINNGNPKYHKKKEKDTKDKIFLLSYDEINKYFHQEDMLDFNSRLLAKSTRYAIHNGLIVNKINDDLKKLNEGCGSYWLRTAGHYPVNHSLVVRANGSIDFYGYFYDIEGIGVRPAMWILY